MREVERRDHTFVQISDVKMDKNTRLFETVRGELVMVAFIL